MCCPCSACGGAAGGNDFLTGSVRGNPQNATGSSQDGRLGSWAPCSIMLTFPDESLKITLIKLNVARCKVNVLPSYLSSFQELKYLDARDNNITYIDDSLKSLIKQNKVESYFSGNSVCKIDKSLDCEPLCSKTCWSRQVSNDGYCDVECNTKECKFDGEDCR